MNFRELRKGMLVLVNTLQKMENSREMSLVKTSLQKTQMWSGYYLKHSNLGENPYAKADGKRKEVKDILPLFDSTKAVLSSEILNQGHIFTVDTIRQYLDDYNSALIQYMLNNDLENNLSKEEVVMTNMDLFNIYTNLNEARMWLGMELGRIRDNG